jgi:ABC-type sugar transport system ATPase subunit
MGRALVREPTVFLLDEPLSNLDARLRTQVRAEIAELQRRTRATMLYVTHDQVEAMTLGQRVAVLHEGWLQQVATPRELYERPANVFVASFIGSPPMNQFPTRVSRDGRGQTLMTVGEQSVTLPEASGIAALGERNGSFTAGIRPEALRLSSEESRGSFLAVVESVEFLGHESLIYSRVEATAPSRTVKLTARIEGAHDLSRGEKVRFEADARQIHFFDENGRRVGR